MQSQIRFPKEAKLHSPGSPQALPQDPTDGRAEPAHYTEGETEARWRQSGVSCPGQEERDGLQLFTPAGLWSLSSRWKENLNPALLVSSSLGFCPVSMETSFGPLGGKLQHVVTVQIFLCPARL